MGAVAGGISGDSAASAQLAGVIAKNAVENNLLLNDKAYKNLSESEKSLYDKVKKKLEANGIPDIDDYHQELAACGSNSRCIQNTKTQWVKYNQQSINALTEMAEDGELSLTEAKTFFTSIAKSIASADLSGAYGGLGGADAASWLDSIGGQYAQDELSDATPVFKAAWEHQQKQAGWTDEEIAAKETEENSPWSIIAQGIASSIGAGKTSKTSERSTKETPVYKTTKEATAAAQALGFVKTNYYVKGQAVYYNKNLKMYITRDIDGHNGGAWKGANSVENLGSKTTRSSTLDANLNRIGD